MSDPEILPPSLEPHAKDRLSPSPSLALIYGLIALALAAAIGLALLIVLPFYRRR
jgi:hypothetical protein